MRTILNRDIHLTPLDAAIGHFITVLLREHRYSEMYRQLFALSAKFGGLGIIIPLQIADIQYKNSRAVKEDLVEKVNAQEHGCIQFQSRQTKTNKNLINNETK